MVLDTVTLRIAFALMALVLGLLFYFSAYRFTRSPYSGWWCLALVFFLAGSASLPALTERPTSGGPTRWETCLLVHGAWQRLGRCHGRCGRPHTQRLDFHGVTAV